MGCRTFFLFTTFVVPILIGHVAAAGDMGKTSKEVRLHLGQSRDKELKGPSDRPMLSERREGQQVKKERPKNHHVTVKKHRQVPGFPPKQRSPELSPTQLVVVGFDAHGREIARVVIPDPRLLRTEAVGFSGEMISETFYLAEVDLTVVLPDDPRIRLLKIYHPNWNGTELTLELIGETPLP